jgi:hypothetical protein
MTEQSTKNLEVKHRRFLPLFLKSFKWSLIIIVLLHFVDVIQRGFEYPFDSLGDFFKKLIITLGFALPIYIVISVFLGLIIGLISWTITKRHTTSALKNKG